MVGALIGVIKLRSPQFGIAIERPGRTVGLHSSCHLGRKAQTYAHAIVGYMNVNEVRHAVRFCRDCRLIGQVDCFRVCTEKFVVLINLANLPGTESYIRAEFCIVGFNPQPGWGNHLLPIDKHAVLKSAVRRA